MMYEALAPYYDALVKDDEATKAWVDVIKAHIPCGTVLELACGSGEITIALAKQGYTMHASDLSAQMIEAAKAKEGSEQVDWFVMDMCDFHVEKRYEGILCLCDSMNYILKKEQIKNLFKNVWEHLLPGGCFIMDMHSLDRLSEFREEYNEAGHIAGGVDVQWTILSEEDRIYQNFAFYHSDGTVALEQHIQRVYDPQWILECLQQQGFQVEVLTDFTTPGIAAGEKQFYICRREQ